uniref:Alcohol dehydrogenase-like N-terminal domain-containing protein n=1 Tax=Sinocyclocheilus rhinocerous TaxID=307959 RepID=A0A673ITP7_9TELE
SVLKVIKCRAAVAWEPNAPLIVASSLCHAEIFHLFEGKDKRGFPTVLGHEGAGVVESVRPGVTDFKPGHKVKCLDFYFKKHN